MGFEGITRYIPATLSARIIILFCAAIMLIEGLNLFSLKSIQENYIQQTMRGED